MLLDIPETHMSCGELNSRELDNGKLQWEKVVEHHLNFDANIPTCNAACCLYGIPKVTIMNM